MGLDEVHKIVASNDREAVGTGRRVDSTSTSRAARVPLACLSLCLLLLPATRLSSSGRAGAAGFDRSRVAWSLLDYRASKLGFTITSDVRLAAVTSSQAAASMIDPERGEGLAPRGTDTLVLTLGSKIMGRKSTLDFWFNPRDAAGLQRIQLETARKTRNNRYKVNRYTRTGVYHLTRRPTDQEVGLPHERWSRASDGFYSYAERGVSAAAITEPPALFYILSTAGLDEPRDRIEVHVFSKSHVMRVELRVEEKTKLKADYEEVSAHGNRSVKGSVDVLRVSLEGRPVERGAVASDFEFMGLRGDVDLYIDRTLRVPLQISGHIKYAGRGNVRLRRVVLR